MMMEIIMYNILLLIKLTVVFNYTKKSLRNLKLETTPLVTEIVSPPIGLNNNSYIIVQSW